MADTRKQDKPLGSPADFERAFPGLEHAVMEYGAERPGGAFQTDRPLPTTRLRLRKRGPIMHCLNPNCIHGGYDVRRLVREMLGAGELEHAGRISCVSKEGDPGKAWEQCTDCLWSWDSGLLWCPGRKALER